MGSEKQYPEQVKAVLKHSAILSAADFQQLYEHYLPQLKTYLIRRGCPAPQVDDIAQDAVLIAWRQREAFRGDAPFWAYLLGIARNLLRHAWRDGALHNTASLDSNYLSSPANTPTARIELKELLGLMKQHLSFEQWQAMELIYLNNLSAEQAAEHASCDLPAFYARLSRARKKLAEVIKETDST
jgi:RNA polymerase sigma-70 factor, ECF subfamily